MEAFYVLLKQPSQVLRKVVIKYFLKVNNTLKVKYRLENLYEETAQTK